ncbi:uncharacterized protein LOC110806691 [Carica papaya]|uniref:uncharacterized protein LOC110806691 n=1 Tax=Carica papaya TaxID=3649 RepID=UPI000B8C85E6|nr:uncharacterized protein LOC110806691 [Carica papaya]
MAVSSGILSTFLCSEPAPFFSNSSPSSLRLFPSLSLPPANLQMARTVTYATASKPATGKREPRGIMKPRRVSPEMQALVGVPEIPRTQVLKLIWAYIKENNLQVCLPSSDTFCFLSSYGSRKFLAFLGFLWFSFESVTDE